MAKFALHASHATTSRIEIYPDNADSNLVSTFLDAEWALSGMVNPNGVSNSNWEFRT